MPILDEIVAHKRQEIAFKKSHSPLYAVFPLAEPLFEKALPGLILEIKPASPSSGIMQPVVNLEKLLNIYNQYASAISVLTDEKYFQGSVKLLTDVLQQTPHPVLCKDFILDPYQIDEARQAGAHAILLIVKILKDHELADLFQHAEKLGMTAMVEVQNEAELSRALSLHPRCILINNRNLETFEINFDTTRQLAPLIPKDIIIISASGIEKRDDIRQLLPYASCFLIGSALMKAPDLEKKLQELTA